MTAAFYYDTNNSGLDGTAITGACAAAPEGTNVPCAWDTTGMTPGTYYVYGIANDGSNPQVSAYSPGVITINPVPCVRSAPTVTMGPSGVVTQAGAKVYTISVTNNDTASCSNSTFTLGIGSETGNTASFVLPSVISPTTTGALAPGATYTGSTMTVTAQAAATIGHALTTTVNATDGTNHAAQPGSGNVTTTVARSTLLHNSQNMTANYATKNNYWNAQGGWGIAGGVYGEFTCETCHIKTTTNIKRVKTSITVPDTSKGNIPGSTVNFQSVSGTTNGFGDDQVARISSTRICEVCHTLTTYHKYNQPLSLHENTATTPANYQDCINCHEHNNGFAAPGCIDCHVTQQGSRAAVVGQFSSNSHHVQGVTLTNAHCYQCHWEANANGSMNTTYHLGWRNGLAGVSNSAVDLVVWTTATRPAAYTLGTTAVQYIASPASRTEYAKISTHCLGCHNDTNLNTQPFGDGMKTSQYAWDGSSVSNRYTQAGTTTWGKYTTTTNAAQKNVTKAYSAHGNAANNNRGWNTTTGVDAAITNTSGNVQILCFDCHNSHGSSAGSTSQPTTSYASATVTGGILKDVTNGIGGSTATYKPAVGGSVANKNVRNPGASLCFDCHLNANSSATRPWGYSGTFGATQQIISYWEKPYWEGAAGVNPAGAQQRYAYKNSLGSIGGHFGASSAMMTAPMGTIGGLCTPCHDPHGVTSNTTKIAATDKQYAVPLLKGTWVTSPYKEDAAPQAMNLVTGDSTANKSGCPDCSFEWPYNGRSDPGYKIDQNTFGTISGTNWQWGSQYTASGITQTSSQFGGLCLQCHTQASLNPSTGATAWKGMDRIHNTVAGWGGSGANAGNAIHKFTCSKCHTPHNSCLPRLMVSNCLNYSHRGRVASGGTAGQFTTWGYSAPYTNQNYGRDGGGAGQFPSGGGGGGNNPTNRGPYYFGGEGWTCTGDCRNTDPRNITLVQCHNVTNAGGTSFPSSQLWNVRTPW